MRDIFLAAALVWCAYNSWQLRHNFKVDKQSNLLDQSMLKILKIHCNRLDVIEDALGIKPKPEPSEEFEMCEDLIMFSDSKFYEKCFPDDPGFGLYDLVAKYGLRVVMDKWEPYYLEMRREK